MVDNIDVSPAKGSSKSVASDCTVELNGDN